MIKSMCYTLSMCVHSVLELNTWYKYLNENFMSRGYLGVK